MKYEKRFLKLKCFPLKRDVIAYNAYTVYFKIMKTGEFGVVFGLQHTFQFQTAFVDLLL